ncbi:putative leucine-rich repeat-containing protein DDB_G0290503 isoform X2 [Chenopodium quinoa]|uniref:putative leucine-rich repeat-containing protein DDB_G0290503 isoform X2 n=1 Tax=Chenopodium quinoa TaxID=63459 RepID=UPI000B7894CC|nr:putative leucine-rich repeat-containing protein DDB_G0290503 isoform X2 [Chenopodium quinoa]
MASVSGKEKKERERILSRKGTTVNPTKPPEFGAPNPLDYVEQSLYESFKDSEKEFQDPLYDEQQKKERMDKGIDGHRVHIRSEPVIEVLSVSLCNLNQNDCTLNASNKDAWEIYGTVYVHDGMDHMGIGSNRIVFFHREEDVDDPEIIPLVGGALSLTGPDSVMSMVKPVIGIHLSDKLTGETLIFNYAPLLKTTDTAGQHHQLEQFHKITVPGTACSAEVEYLGLTFGVYAHVKVQLAKQQVVRSVSYEEDEEDEEYLDIYGTISAAYNLYYSENKVDCINLFEIKEDSDKSEKVRIRFPVTEITLSRSVVAVPAYSLLTIQMKLWDRAKNELIVEGSYDFETCNYPTNMIIVGQNCIDAKVTIHWREPFRLDEPLIKQHEFDPQESLSILPNSPSIPVFPVAEVFSVFIGRQNEEQLNLYGMVNFCSTYGVFNLFKRDKTDPVILSPGCNLLPLKGPGDALIPGDSFYVSVDLEDVEGRVSIKGLAHSSVGIDKHLSFWHDCLLCSVIRSVQEHSFAAIHYTVFSHALKATLKIRFLFNGEHSTQACCKIYGNLVVSYGEYGYETPYEKLYHRIVLFERLEEDVLEVPCKDFDMELLRPVVAVPHDSFLRIAINLSCQSSGLTQLLRDTKEFHVGSGVNGLIIEGDQVGINITIEWSCADFEVKMQETMANFSEKECEANSLSEKLKILEDKVQSYEEQVGEAALKAASLTEELHQSAAKVYSLESSNEELKKMIEEAEGKVAQSLSEKELLVETNSQLMNKVDKLQEFLNSADAEKEATSLQLASHMNTITELTEQHSRSFKQHSAAEARHSQAEEQLKETSGRLAEKEKEVEELGARLSTLESQVKAYEEEAREASGIAESRKVEIEQLKEIVATLDDKEAEIKELSEKLVALEGQVKKYEEEAHEAEGIAESNKVEIREMADKLSQKELEVTELKEKLASLEGQVKVHEEEAGQVSGIAESRKVQIEDLVEKLSQKEIEVKELNEKLTSLEEQLTVHKEAALEASGIAESRKSEIEQLQVSVEALAQKELEIKDLNEKISSLEDQLKKHQEEALEVSGIVESRKVEIEDLTEKLGQKEMEVKELNEKVISLEGQVTVHQDSAREASGIAESRKAEIEQLQVTVETLAQRELEIKELNEKLSSLEDQLKKYQEEALEVSGIAESRKLEVEDLLLKLQEQAKLADERQAQLGLVETRNEALAEANMKLTQDLALAETEQSDLQAKLSHALDEKEDIAAKCFLSDKANEELRQELTSEKERLQSEISAVLKESSQLHETIKEHQAVVVQLEEQLKEYRGKEDASKAEIDNLKVEITEKSALQARLKELEEQYQATEAQLKEEVKNLQTSATTREVDLTSQLEHHVQKLQDRDLLNERVLKLNEELQLAEANLTKLKEESSAKVSELEAAKSRTSEELDAKNKEIMLLGKKIEEFEQKLQKVVAASKQKVDESNADTKEGETEVRSRDIGSMISSPTKRKSKKSEKLSAQTSPSSSVVQTPTAEASSSMNIKFILGVALVSIVLGVILGKRY